MAEVYKLIHPVKYFTDYISQDVRPDGRYFYEQRDIKLNVNSIKTAEASSVVKCGNTTVVCGIQLELAKPKAETPDMGFLVTNIELPPLCSSKYRPGPPSDHAQVTSNMVSDIILNSKCVDLKDLCIAHDKLAWVVYCDIVCTDNDGSIVDTAIVALMASLRTLSLPTVNYDVETEEIQVDPDVRAPLKIHQLPVATSFTSYKVDDRNILIADPTAYEEEMCGGVSSTFFIVTHKNNFSGIQKFGGTELESEMLDEAIEIAKERAILIEKAIDSCINNKG